MYSHKDVLIFFTVSFPSAVLEPVSLSVSHYYPIDYKQSLCRASICTSAEKNYYRKRVDELYNTPLKKRKKRGKKRTRHTSASSPIMIISVDCNDTFTNKTMTWTFSYIRNNETT